MKYFSNKHAIIITQYFSLMPSVKTAPEGDFMKLILFVFEIWEEMFPSNAASCVQEL
jgi:hypothetical protein